MSAHRRIAAFPTTPAEIPNDATMVELLDAYERHLYAVARGREPVAVGQLVGTQLRRWPWLKHWSTPS